MKALITQREGIDSHGEKLDILESGYISFFEELGIELRQVSNYLKSITTIVSSNDLDCIILSGGGTIGSQYYTDPHREPLQMERDQVELNLIKWGLKNHIPILGICRGMQYLNGFLGGKISKLNLPREPAKDHKILLTETGVDLLVNSFHNDGIRHAYLAPSLQAFALDEEYKIVEGFYSKDLQIMGVQWHPERRFLLAKDKVKSTQLITNFLNYSREK